MNEGDRPVSEHAVPAGRAEDVQAASRATPGGQGELAQLEAVMHAIPDGVMVFDAAGTLLRMNPAAEEIWRNAGIEVRYGPPDPDALARFQLHGEDGRPLPRERWPAWRAIRGETLRGVHVTFNPSGARPLWMLVSAAPIRDADGAVTGAVLTFSDETAVRELAEARDDLVRMVSHDLRAPLSAIYGQAHLIRRAAGESDKVQARAAAIERSCERMSGMIQDLVEVTLLEAGQLPLAPARVDAATLLPDIVDGLRGGMDVDRVRLEVQSPCWASLDPARLERIVVNLVSNALKYSSGDVQVLLTGEGGDVVLTVADRGVGISTEDQARIFERYYRARGERQPEGLGLGLYITRLLVEAQGGNVEVQSQLGSGSTFRVRFPGAGGA
ncbi:MAG TPA: ATP-binding protein [Anaeromyxobacter sp.]|nr:ATP-binding protein [Anaeromyxobacter sp.]